MIGFNFSQQCGIFCSYADAYYVSALVIMFHFMLYVVAFFCYFLSYLQVIPRLLSMLSDLMLYPPQARLHLHALHSHQERAFRQHLLTLAL
jgi:hypothetical protein